MRSLGAACFLLLGCLHGSDDRTSRSASAAIETQGSSSESPTASTGEPVHAELSHEAMCAIGYRIVTRVPLPCPIVQLVDRSIEVPSWFHLQVACPGHASSYVAFTIRDARDPQRDADVLHSDTPYEPSDSFPAGSCEEYAMQGDETVGVWNRLGVAVWDGRHGSLLHTLQIESDTLVSRTDHPSKLLSLAFAGDAIYLFTETALLVVERCGDGPWLEETDIWRFRGPDLSLADAIGACANREG